MNNTRKALSMLLLSLFCFSFAVAQNTGIVKEDLSFKSQVLNREVNYSIYLPADYDTSERKYPVLYLLHGYSDNHTSWIQFGQMNKILDDCIAQRLCPDMIVVMPDAKVTWYINDASGGEQYEDMFIKELIPYIDETYRTRNTKETRAIAGLSMGGYGSMLYALKYPELFSACCPLSPALYTDENMKKVEESDYKTKYKPFYVSGQDRMNQHWYANSTHYLVQNMDKKQVVRFYIDCGDDDFLYEGNALMHILLRQKGIPHEFRVRNGGHTWVYWREALPEVFKFVGKSFTR